MKEVYEKDLKEHMCPICGEEKLYYDEFEFFNDNKGVIADWHCSNCRGHGSIDYSLQFLKYNNIYTEDCEEVNIKYPKESE